MRDRPLQWSQLKNIYSKGMAFWKAKVHEVDVGSGSRGSLKKNGQHLLQCRRLKLCREVRAAGVGRKDDFKHVREAVRVWVQSERENGHAFEGHDLIEEFLYIL